MNTNNVEKWCNDLLIFWKKKEIENILNLFDKKVEYYETPNEKITDIRKVWEEIKNQDTENIEFTILCQSNNKCVANYIIRGKETYDMVYEIILNENNQCIYFKQWYMEV